LISVRIGVVGGALPGALGSDLISAAGTTVTRDTDGSMIQAGRSSSVEEVGVSSYGDGLRYLFRLVSGDDYIELWRSDETVEASNSLGDFHNIGMRGSSLHGDGEYYVSIFTDHEGGNDPDHLTGGYWLYVPAEPSGDNALPRFGAFSFGNVRSDPPLAGLSTTASYIGKATGICECEGASDTVASRVFEANAVLEAQFNDSGSNTISGAITGFVFDGERPTGDRARTVSLLRQELTSGFFTGGNTSLDGEINVQTELVTGSDHGEWGGEFYGIRDTANLLPGYIGGTFGASDGIETFVGAFGTRRHDALFPESYFRWFDFQSLTFPDISSTIAYSALIEGKISDATGQQPLDGVELDLTGDTPVTIQASATSQASSTEVTGVNVRISGDRTTGLDYFWEIDTLSHVTVTLDMAPDGAPPSTATYPLTIEYMDPEQIEVNSAFTATELSFTGEVVTVVEDGVTMFFPMAATMTLNVDNQYTVHADDAVGQGTFEGFSFIEMERNIPIDPTLNDLDEIQQQSSSGTWLVNIFTDYEGSDDTDYLAGGVWLYFDHDDPSTSETFADVGVFADGNNPFEYQTATLLDGVATYDGVAAGVYCECDESFTPDEMRDNNVIGQFEADVFLTADFTDDITDDMISGSVTNFILDGLGFDDTTIYLQSAVIDDVAGGFFSGNTSFEGTDGADAGEWAGNFYGDVDGANAPGSVAGTFGASSDTHSFLGAFGAYHADEEQQ